MPSLQAGGPACMSWRMSERITSRITSRITWRIIRRVICHGFAISWVGVSAALAQAPASEPQTVSAGSIGLRGGFDSNPTDTLGARGSTFATQTIDYDYLRGSDGEGIGLKLHVA